MSLNTKLSIPFFKPHLNRDEIVAVKRIIRSGWLTSGSETMAFEQEFANFVKQNSKQNSLYTVAVNSGTAGLHLALEALGISTGDKVAVPSLTFTATAAVIRYLGADPVFIDSVPETGHMNPEHLYKVRNDIKAVIPVHLYGHPCDIATIREAVTPSTPIIEDAAHALPAHSKNEMVGTLGDIGVFSFYATKTITTGEGGMILCKDSQLHERMKMTRLHGIDRNVWNRYNTLAENRSWEYDIVHLGYKYNLTNLAAAIGRVQLSKIDYLLSQRKKQALYYTEALSNIKNLEPPMDTPGHAWHLYVIKLKNGDVRDRLAQRLHNEGIGSSVHFIPLHRMSYWKKTYHLHASDFPIADALADRILSIPLWPGLKKIEQNRIVRILRNELHGQ